MGLGGGRVILAGPTTGYPDANRPAFDYAAAQLRALGYEVFSPLEGDSGDLLADVTAELDALQDADLLVYLPGALEAPLPSVILAEAFGIPMAPLSQLVSQSA